MKKGKQYSEKKIILFTLRKSRAGWLSLGFFGAVIISLPKLISEIIICSKTGVNLSNCITSSDFWDCLLAAALLISALIGFVKSITNLFRAYFRHRIIKKEYRTDLAANITSKVSPKLRENGYKWQKCGPETVMFSEQANDCLRQHASDFLLDVDKKKQRMSGKQRQLIYRIVKEKIDNGTQIFNSDLVKIGDDILAESRYGFPPFQESEESETVLSPEVLRVKRLQKHILHLKKTDYFNNISSNDLIFTRVFGLDGEILFEGKDMSADGDNVIFDLSESPAANIVGVNTVAVTKESADEPACIIVHRQANNNDVYNNSFVPTASGSADFKDLLIDSQAVSVTKEKRSFAAISSQKKKISTIKKARREKRRRVAEKISDFKRKIREISREIKSLKKQNESLEKQIAAMTEKKREPSQRDSLNAAMTQAAEQREKIKTTIRDKWKDFNAYRVSVTTLSRHLRYLKRMKNFRFSLEDFLITATQRELTEEGYFDKDDIIKTQLLGSFRLLSRGGKPDFFSVTFLNKTKSECQKAFKEKQLLVYTKEMASDKLINDFAEIAEQVYIPLSVILNPDPARPSLEELCEQYRSNNNSPLPTQTPSEKQKSSASPQLLYSEKLLISFAKTQ